MTSKQSQIQQPFAKEILASEFLSELLEVFDKVTINEILRAFSESLHTDKKISFVEEKKPETIFGIKNCLIAAVLEQGSAKQYKKFVLKIKKKRKVLSKFTIMLYEEQTHVLISSENITDKFLIKIVKTLNILQDLSELFTFRIGKRTLTYDDILCNFDSPKTWKIHIGYGNLMIPKLPNTQTVAKYFSANNLEHGSTFIYLSYLTKDLINDIPIMTYSLCSG